MPDTPRQAPPTQKGGLVLLLLRIRISLAAGLNIEQMEPPQIFHYALGQEIKSHYDSLYDKEHPYGREGTCQGDRLATFLMYLNDDYAGGDLDFVKPALPTRARPATAFFLPACARASPTPKACTVPAR